MTLTDPIDMVAKDHGYFPKTFLWRDRRYQVDAIEQCWTIAQRTWMGRVERHGFRVRSGKGVYTLYHDIRNNSWCMERQIRSLKGRD